VRRTLDLSRGLSCFAGLIRISPWFDFDGRLIVLVVLSKGGEAMARGGKRLGAGRPKGAKNKRTIAKVALIPALQHRQTAEALPLDILTEAMRDTALPVELRLAAAARAAPYFHAKVSSGPPKASFEMTQSELEAAIAREKEHFLRADPGPRIQVVRR
jgi:hypothetical protein